MPHTPLRKDDALLLVDLQIDFFTGGALAVPDAESVLPPLAAWIEDAHQKRVSVLATRDWHPAHHVSFEPQGGPWPPHCVQYSEGARIHPDLDLPPGTIIIQKGTEKDRDAYSAFDNTGLAARLKRANIQRLFTAGLALDVCVKASVLDGLKAGFEMHLIAEATRPVDPAKQAAVIEELKQAGAHVEEPVAASV